VYSALSQSGVTRFESVKGNWLSQREFLFLFQFVQKVLTMGQGLLSRILVISFLPYLTVGSWRQHYIQRTFRMHSKAEANKVKYLFRVSLWNA
jgi:hypothetical protein